MISSRCMLPLMGVFYSSILAQTFPATGQLSIGREHILTINASGVPSSWGANESGQLGIGTTTDRTVTGGLSTPEGGTTLTYSAISAGNAHSLAIRGSNGTVFAWGLNNAGQLGDNTTTNRLRRVAVRGLNNSATPITGIVAVSAGGSHSLMLGGPSFTIGGDGGRYVYQFGSHGLSAGGTYSLYPVLVAGVGGVGTLSGITAISAGSGHSLALRPFLYGPGISDTGAVYAWGSGSDGQLGDGTQTTQSSPVISTAPGFTYITAISAGKGFNLALKSDGTVWAWGRNDQGQLGLGDTTLRLVPTQIPGLTGVTAIAAGYTHAIVARAGGDEVWGWGTSSMGELGPSFIGPALQPIKIPGFGGTDAAGRPTRVESLKAGKNLSGALLTNGSVLTWGDNSHGYLGDSTLPYRTKFVAVTDAKQASQLYAGGDVSFLRRENGRLFAFGENDAGQLGLVHTDHVLKPEPFRYDAGLGRLATKVVTNGRSTLMIVSGYVFAFGENSNGELGLGHTSSVLGGQFIPGFTNVVDITLGTNFAIARKSDGTLWVWGANSSNQLGLGDTLPRLSPTQLPALPGLGAAAPAFIGAGDKHAVVIDDAGYIYVWGANNLNQLGDGTLVARTTPLRLASAIPATYGSVTSLRIGLNHNLVQTTGGRVYVWGHGAYGQLGTASTANKTSPTLLSFTGALEIAAGSNHSLVRRATDLIAFGLNTYGQLGDGTMANRSSAVDVVGLTDSIAIAAGADHSLAIRADGTVVAWGDDSNRQLGYDSNTLTRIPDTIATLTDPSVADSDGDGLPNYWESLHTVTSIAATADGDSDGLLTIHEFHRGTNPKVADTDGDVVKDFADTNSSSTTNANSYALSIISGGDQTGLVASDASFPIQIKVSPPASLAISASDPTIRLATTASGISSGSDVLIASSNSAGDLPVYYRHRSTPGLASVFIEAGIESVTAYNTALTAAQLIDSDDDGLSDEAEQTAGTVNGLKDSDGDGVKDGWDYAPTQPAITTPPYSGYLNMTLLNPAGTSPLP